MIDILYRTEFFSSDPFLYVFSWHAFCMVYSDGCHRDILSIAIWLYKYAHIVRPPAVTA